MNVLLLRDYKNDVISALYHKCLQNWLCLSRWKIEDAFTSSYNPGVETIWKYDNVFNVFVDAALHSTSKACLKRKEELELLLNKRNA
jgi:hypothetical protein